MVIEYIRYEIPAERHAAFLEAYRAAKQELGAPPRMDLVAAPDVDRLAGAAQLADLLDAVPDHRCELARAVSDGDLHEVPTLALRAHFDGPDEKDLVQLLAVGEVANKHAQNRRTGRGRLSVNA